MMLQRMHALGRYLKNMGVTTIFVDETRSITGEFNATQENISYLADNIVFLRHLELQGELRKAIGVLKKRTSDFERTLREFEITEHGIKVGEPLTNMRGILSGTPEIVRSEAHTPDESE
jgi:circadian clock protein KaiC